MHQEGWSLENKGPVGGVQELVCHPREVRVAAAAAVASKPSEKWQQFAQILGARHEHGAKLLRGCPLSWTERREWWPRDVRVTLASNLHKEKTLLLQDSESRASSKREPRTLSSHEPSSTEQQHKPSSAGAHSYVDTGRLLDIPSPTVGTAFEDCHNEAAITVLEHKPRSVAEEMHSARQPRRDSTGVAGSGYENIVSQPLMLSLI